VWYGAAMMTTGRGFINVYSRRAKLLDLKFFIRRTFH